MVERDCCWGEDGSRREGQAGFWDASARPGAGFCSLLSSPLPLQQLWLAWRMFKLIQLSEGLFLVQSALDLAAAHRALLSCCPGCCWFGEARASPWLCPCSHPLLQPAHRTIGPCSCASSAGLFLSHFLCTIIGEHIGKHIAAVAGPRPACGQQLPPPQLSVRPGQAEGAMDVYPGRGGMEATVLCSALC